MQNEQIAIPYEILKLEDTEVITTNKDNEYTEFDDTPFNDCYSFLYHGIRNQKYLEKLENIFKEKKILAGKYLKNYYNYSDNCNKGEYVSLLNLSKTNKISFETFIEENISLLVTPYCNAIETKYVDFYTWDKIKNLDLKQIYSYMPGEYLSKDYIPIEYVKAIGIPYIRMVREKGSAYTDNLLNDIKLLMEKYDISLAIVDTSRFNQLLTSSNNKERKNNSHSLVRKNLIK